MSTALDKSLDDVSVLKFCPLAARRLAMRLNVLDHLFATKGS